MRETMLVNFRKNSTSNTHNLYPHRTSRNMYTGCTRNRNINRKATIHCGKVSRKCRMIIFDTDSIFEKIDYGVPLARLVLLLYQSRFYRKRSLVSKIVTLHFRFTFALHHNFPYTVYIIELEVLYN